MRDCKWRDTEGICVIDCKLCDECKEPMYIDTDCLYKMPATPSDIVDSIEKSMQTDCIYCERGNCDLSGLGCSGKKPEPEKTEVTPDKPEIPTVKNLSQLKKAIQPGMMFEITDHFRPECIGERRVVTSVTTVDFTSRKLDENGEPTGKDLHMEFDRAKNWTFNGGELTSRLDSGDMLMSFHFV